MIGVAAHGSPPLRPERLDRPDLGELAALLERSYRLALWLQDTAPPADDPASPDAFAAFVASSELVAVLDEARALLVAPRAAASTSPSMPAAMTGATPAGITSAGTSPPAHSSVRPDR